MFTITQPVSFNLTTIPAVAFTFTRPVIAPISNKAGTIIGSLAIVVLDPTYDFSGSLWGVDDTRFVVNKLSATTANLVVGPADIAQSGTVAYMPNVSVTF